MLLSCLPEVDKLELVARASVLSPVSASLHKLLAESADDTTFWPQYIPAKSQLAKHWPGRACQHASLLYLAITYAFHRIYSLWCGGRCSEAPINPFESALVSIHSAPRLRVKTFRTQTNQHLRAS